MKTSGYGRWTRPSFGWLHTRSPGTHVTLRWPAGLLPREGGGDYRHPVARRQGANQRSYSSDRSLWHNPVRFQIESDSRAERAEAEYIRRQNGRGMFRPYVWRAPGWEDRLARFGLDLAELADADAELERAIADRRHVLNGFARRYRGR